MADDAARLPRRVTIIGTGGVGQTLASGWARAGVEVLFGSRDPEGPRASAAVAAVSGSRSATIAEAVAGAEVVLLAVPFRAVAPLLAALTAGALDGAIVIDATNTFPGPPDDAPSGAERIARAAPGARVVKAFNTIGTEVMADARVEGRAVDLLMAGDDGAVAVAAALARALGFTPVPVGDLSLAADLEALARLWVTLAMRRGYGRRAAFAWLHEGAITH